MRRAGQISMTRSLVIFGWLAMPSTAAVAENWVEIRGPHFTVLSDAGEKRAREVAEELEKIRHVFRATLPSADLDPALPVTVLAVRNERGLEELLPQLWEGDGPRPKGAFFRVPDGYVVVLRTDVKSSERTESIYHEYFHLLTSLNLRDVPVWLDEGLAEFWSQTVVRKNIAELGRANPTHIRSLKRGMMPLRALLSATVNPHGSDPGHVGVFYAQSWALTHLLMMQNGNRSSREQLAAYVGRVRDGQDAVTAFEAVFGRVDRVEAELKEYVERRELLAMRVDVGPVLDASVFPTRTMSDSEALAVRGRILAFGARPEAALPLLRESLRLDPESSLAMEGLGVYHFRGGAFDEARAWLERAVESGSDSFLAYYFLSQTEKSGGDLSTPAIEVALRRAIALEPDFAPALSELASHLAARHERLDEALGLATQATKLQPESAWAWIHLGMVCAVAGRADEARDAGGRADAVAKTQLERQAVEELRLMVEELKLPR